MTHMSSPTVWHEFAHDPRDPSHAALRAADADRDVVRRVLGDAYAEGRLDREEFDERTDVVARSRTLGELPAIIDDLVPTTAALSTTGGQGPQTVEERAVRRYERGRREAVGRFVFVSLLCWGIWLATGFGGDGFDANFPWPLFVMFGTGIPAFRYLTGRADIIADEVRRIEKKDRKELEQREIKELERRERRRALGHGDLHDGAHGDLHGRREPED